MTRTNHIEVFNRASVTGATPSETDAPSRYNIVLTQENGTWSADPGVLRVFAPFGMDATAYLKWYINPDPQLTSSATFAPDGIVFHTPPAGMAVNYNPDRTTASVNWSDGLLGTEPLSVSFQYTFNLIVVDQAGNSTTVSVDPTVVNDPPGPGGFLDEPVAPREAARAYA
jgi:hypothetical protein